MSGFSHPRRFRQSVTILIVALLAVANAWSLEKPTQPDIILILADDLGFSDLGCQGGEILTPNIDSLAAQGARFTNASNTSRCCPSRAALLTGVYPHRVGMGWMTAADLGRPAYRGELAANCSTLAEVLKTAGYQCFMAGKWHLTADAHSTRPPAVSSWPTRRGFEEFFGIIGGGSSYTAPEFLVRNETPVEPGPGFWLTDAISDGAVDFCKKPLPGPRFVYVAYTAPHWPLHAPQEEVDRNLPNYQAGYETILKQRLARIRQLGLLTAGQHPAPGSIPDWASLPPDVQADQSRRMAIYAAQVQAMDRGVGRILKAVAEGGRADNTLVIFASDNGACAEVLEAPPLPANLTDSLRSSYGTAWASISSLPFRGQKKDPLQGGVATPFFVRWPGHATAGTRISDPIHFIDVLPTCADAAGVAIPPKQPPSGSITPDGVSLLPTLSGKSLPPRNIYFEHEGGRAIRRGNIKAVAMPNSTTWQLYDLEHDPAETRDLAAERPDELLNLQTAWNQWAEANKLLPLDTRDWGQRVGASPVKSKAE